MMKIQKLLTTIFVAFCMNACGSEFMLPSWLEKNSGFQKEKEKLHINKECTLKVTNNECISVITPYGEGCHKELNFRRMLKGYWNLKNFYKLTDGRLPAEKFYVIAIRVNNCNQSVIFEAKSTTTINFLDRYLLLTSVIMETTFNDYKAKIINNSKVLINVKGNTELNGKLQTIYIVKSYSENQFRIAIKGDNLKFLDLLRTFRIEERFYNTLCIPVDRDVLENMEFKKFQMKGVYNVSKGFYLSATAVIKKLGSKETSYIEILLVRMRYEPVKLAFILKGKLEEDIIPFISNVLQRHRSSIPILEKSVDLGVLSISGQQITRNEISTQTHLDVIPKGITLQTISTFHEKRRNLSNVTDTKSLVRTKLRMCQSRDTVDFNPKTEVNVHEFLGKIADADISFPEWLQTETTVKAKIQKLTYSGANKNKVSLYASITSSIKVLFNSIKLDSINLKLLIDKDKNHTSWDCGVAKTKHKVNNADADVMLTCDPGLKNFRLIVNIPCFGFQEFLDLLNVDILPESLRKSMSKLANFQVKEMRVEECKDGSDFMRINGSPILFGLNNLTMEAMAWREGDEKKFVLGIVLKEAKLDEILEKMIGKKLGVTWIDDMKAAIVISNTKLEPEQIIKRRVISNTLLSTRHGNFTFVPSLGHTRSKRDVASIQYQFNPSVVTQNSLQNYPLEGATTSYFYPNRVNQVTQNYNMGQYGAVTSDQPMATRNYMEGSNATPYDSNMTMQSYTNSNENQYGYVTNNNPSLITQSFQQPTLQKAQPAQSSIGGMSQEEMKQTSIMDDLLKAYHDKNEHKAAENRQYQKELNEGVLDPINDKRSMVTNSVATPKHFASKASNIVTKKASGGRKNNTKKNSLDNAVRRHNPVIEKHETSQKPKTNHAKSFDREHPNVVVLHPKLKQKQKAQSTLKVMKDKNINKIKTNKNNNQYSNLKHQKEKKKKETSANKKRSEIKTIERKLHIDESLSLDEIKEKVRNFIKDPTFQKYIEELETTSSNGDNRENIPEIFDDIYNPTQRAINTYQKGAIRLHGITGDGHSDVFHHAPEDEKEEVASVRNKQQIIRKKLRKEGTTSFHKNLTTPSDIEEIADMRESVAIIPETAASIFNLYKKNNKPEANSDDDIAEDEDENYLPSDKYASKPSKIEYKAEQKDTNEITKDNYLIMSFQDKYKAKQTLAKQIMDNEKQNGQENNDVIQEYAKMNEANIKPPENTTNQLLKVIAGNPQDEIQKQLYVPHGYALKQSGKQNQTIAGVDTSKANFTQRRLKNDKQQSSDHGRYQFLPAKHEEFQYNSNNQNNATDIPSSLKNSDKLSMNSSQLNESSDSKEQLNRNKNFAKLYANAKNYIVDSKKKSLYYGNYKFLPLKANQLELTLNLSRLNAKKTNDQNNIIHTQMKVNETITFDSNRNKTAMKNVNTFDNKITSVKKEPTSEDKVISTEGQNVNKSHSNEKSKAHPAAIPNGINVNIISNVSSMNLAQNDSRKLSTEPKLSEKPLAQKNIFFTAIKGNNKNSTGEGMYQVKINKEIQSNANSTFKTNVNKANQKQLVTTDHKLSKIGSESRLNLTNDDADKEDIIVVSKPANIVPKKRRKNHIKEKQNVFHLHLTEDINDNSTEESNHANILTKVSKENTIDNINKTNQALNTTQSTALNSASMQKQNTTNTMSGFKINLGADGEIQIAGPEDEKTANNMLKDRLNNLKYQELISLIKAASNTTSNQTNEPINQLYHTKLTFDNDSIHPNSFLGNRSQEISFTYKTSEDQKQMGNDNKLPENGNVTSAYHDTNSQISPGQVTARTREGTNKKDKNPIESVSKNDTTLQNSSPRDYPLERHLESDSYHSTKSQRKQDVFSVDDVENALDDDGDDDLLKSEEAMKHAHEDNSETDSVNASENEEEIEHHYADEDENLRESLKPQKRKNNVKHVYQGNSTLDLSVNEKELESDGIRNDGDDKPEGQEDTVGETNAKHLKITKVDDEDDDKTENSMGLKSAKSKPIEVDVDDNAASATQRMIKGKNADPVEVDINDETGKTSETESVNLNRNKSDEENDEESSNETKEGDGRKDVSVTGNSRGNVHADTDKSTESEDNEESIEGEDTSHQTVASSNTESEEDDDKSIDPSDDTRAGEIANELNSYANDIRFTGRTKKYKEDYGHSRRLEDVTSILSEYGNKLKHNIHSKKHTQKNKTMYLVKNKNLQVLMEIRPDSKTDSISVETEGLENLLFSKGSSKNYRRKDRMQAKGGKTKDSYGYVDQNIRKLLKNRVINKQNHRVLARKNERYHKRRNHTRKSGKKYYNSDEQLEKELLKENSRHSKELNKKKYHKDERVSDNDDIDDSIDKYKGDLVTDGSLVNDKYESILRPSDKKLEHVELGNSSFVVNGLNEEIRSEVAQIGTLENKENEIYLDKVPGEDNERTNKESNEHSLPNEKSLEHTLLNSQLDYSKKHNITDVTFSKMDDIIEAYNFWNKRKKAEIENHHWLDSEDYKRTIIPETSEDAYNMYNTSIDFGQDLSESDELKHPDAGNTRSEMDSFLFDNSTSEGENVIQKDNKKQKEQDQIIHLHKGQHKFHRASTTKNTVGKWHQKKVIKLQAGYKQAKRIKEKSPIHTKKKKGSNVKYKNKEAIPSKEEMEEQVKAYLYPDEFGKLHDNFILPHKPSQISSTTFHVKEKHKNHKTNHEFILPKKAHSKTKLNLQISNDLKTGQKQTKSQTMKYQKLQTSKHKNAIKLNKHHQQLEFPDQNVYINKTKTMHESRKTENNRNKTLHTEVLGSNLSDKMENPDIQPAETLITNIGEHSETQSTNNTVLGNLDLGNDEKMGEVRNDKHQSIILESFDNISEGQNKTVTAFDNGVDRKMEEFQILQNAKENVSQKKVTTKEKIGTTLKGQGKNLAYGMEGEEKRKVKIKDGLDLLESDASSKTNTTSVAVAPGTWQNVTFQNLNSTDTLFSPKKIEHNRTNIQLNASYSTTGNESNAEVMVRGKAESVALVPKVFLTDELKNLEVAQGVSLSVEFSVADVCGDDKMCTFLKEQLDAINSFKMRGLFSSSGIQLSLKYPAKTDLTETLSLQEIRLSMSAEGTNSNIFIDAVLTMTDPPLKFKGQITVSATGSLQFDMKMKGMWQKAFGIDSVAIGNATLSISYQPGSPLPGFELGGDIWFGVLGTGNEIKTKVFLGFDPVDPTKSYLYGEIKELTVDLLIKAFNRSLTLPQAVKDSGFPDGITIAYTSNPKGMQIPENNVHVGFGLELYGIISILGYKVSCNIKITSGEINIDIQMTPMNIAGNLITMHRSIEDSRNGPSFAINIGKSNLLVKADGAACLLGIQAEASLLITSKTFEIKLNANLFDLMEGNILLEAAVSNQLSAAKFKLEACLAIKVEKLISVITKKLQAIADTAKNAIRRAKDKVKEAGEIFDKAKAKLAEQEAKVKAKEEEINSETRQMLDNRHVVARNCFMHCPKVTCHGHYIEVPRCVKGFNRWLSCRSFRPCYKRSSDLRCVLQCEREKFVKRGFNLLAAANAKIKLSALAASRIALTFAEGFVKLAKVPIKLAERLFRVIEKGVSIGIELANSMLKATLQDIFQFHHFCISANLGDGNGFCARFNMSISLFRNQVSLGGDLCINGKMFDAIGEDVISKQYPGTKKMGDTLKEKEGDFEKLEKECEKVEKMDKKAKSKEEQAKAKRHYVPSNIERYYENILFEPEPGYSFHDDIIANIFGVNRDTDAADVTSDEKEYAIKPTQLRGSDNSSCGNLTKTIYSYNEIAKSLGEVLRREKMEKEYNYRLKNEIDQTLKRYEQASFNMSEYDQDQYEWYTSSLRKSYERWWNSSIEKLEKRQNNIISKYIYQLYDILQHGDLTEFKDYMDSLHEQAKHAIGVKRSFISTTPTEEENLQDIKKSFEELLFKSSYTSLEDKMLQVMKIKRKLSLAQTFNKLCTVSKYVTEKKIG